MLSQLGQPGKGHLALWGRSLTLEDIDELKKEIKTMEEKYRRLSDYNQRFFPQTELHYISCAFIFDEFDSSSFSKISEL